MAKKKPTVYEKYTKESHPGLLKEYDIKTIIDSVPEEDKEKLKLVLIKAKKEDKKHDNRPYLDKAVVRRWFVKNYIEEKKKSDLDIVNEYLDK